MMQPDALLLADALDVVWDAGVVPEAAAELRRLHAERTAADGVINDLVAKVRGLHAQRDALLAVLNKLEYSSDGYIKRYPEEAEVSAAVAKAQQ